MSIFDQKPLKQIARLNELERKAKALSKSNLKKSLEMRDKIQLQKQKHRELRKLLKKGTRLISA